MDIIKECGGFGVKKITLFWLEHHFHLTQFTNLTLLRQFISLRRKKKKNKTLVLYLTSKEV